MAGMPRKLTTALSALILGASAGAVLGGCGSSQTKTETVAETPTVSQSATTTSTHASSTKTATTPPTSRLFKSPGGIARPTTPPSQSTAACMALMGILAKLKML